MIFGILSLEGKSPPQSWIALMEGRAKVWPSAQRLTHATRHAWMAIHPLQEQAGVGRHAHERDQETAAAVMLDGRLDNAEELRSSLASSVPGSMPLLMSAWRQWRHQLPARLVGDFALAVLEGEDRLMLARDHFGVRPLFYTQGDGWFAFASSMDVLLPLPFVDRSADTSWMADYIEGMTADGKTTPYRGICSLEAGTQIAIGPHVSKQRRYWNPPCLDDVLDIDEVEAVEEFRRLFDQAIHARLPAEGCAAFELSGGLDSTSIAVSAAPMMVGRGQRMLTLSHVLSPGAVNRHDLGDERPQIEAVLEVLPPGEHRWLETSHYPQLAAMADTITRHGGPVRRDFNSVQHGVPEAMRAYDCKVLFSGFGGDDIVTSTGAGLLESLAQDGRWDELERIVENPLSRMAWHHAAGRRILRSRAMRNQSKKARAKARLTRSQFLSDLGLTQRRMQFPLVPVWGTIGARERWRAASPALGIRGQDSAVGAGSQGFEYVYPMLDLRLVEFVLRLPDRLKRTTDERRCMIRRAMKGRLPDIVRLRDDKSPSAVPVAAAQFRAEYPEYRALFERHIDDPLLAQILDMRKAIAGLRAFHDRPDPNGAFSMRHYRAIAQLCLWSASMNRGQPNQAE